ncbi:MAG: antitoxin Xre/MbcA/ParS toxin-binding domain-containing protein [Gemmatimonadaceae bacterium]
MADTDVLVLEPDKKTRTALLSTLKSLHCRPLVSGSLEEALGKAKSGQIEAVIADLGQLGTATTATAELIARMTAAIARLRQAHESGARRDDSALARPLRVFVTSASDDADMHAAAIQAGADVFLRVNEARNVTVLASYLARFLQQSAPGQWAPPAVAALPDRVAEAAAPPAPAREITEAFQLHDADLRDPDTGRWDAKRIADALGVRLTELTDAIAANYSTVARTPASDALQARLSPFANVIAMVRQVYTEDDARMKMWLRQSQSALRDRTPLDALLTRGKAPAVQQWVASAWLGEPG